MTASSGICWAPRTVCPSRRSGRQGSAVCPRTNWSPSPGGWRPPAPSSPSAGRCSGRGTVSRRRGWDSPWRRCSARSVFPAAVSATATARSTNSGCHRCGAGCRRCRRASTPCRRFIPVAAITDMLLHPGEPFDYNGRRLTYPDIKLVYWAGGNPFHHHQNIPRLRRALVPRRHDRRARPVLDRDGQARRHRRAVDHRVRARRLLGFPQRPRC